MTTETLAKTNAAKTYKRLKIKQDQIDKYLDNGRDFIPAAQIEHQLRTNAEPDAKRVRDIITKSLAIESLTPDETAVLLNVTDPALLAEMRDAADKIKHKVYDNRIVTFAPLYLSNYCANDCVYCGFRKSNKTAFRKKLNADEVRTETDVLVGKIGHKRLVVVYGEHPDSDVDYIADTIETIYSVKAKTKNSFIQIRRCNINAAPMSIEDLRTLHEVGIGTFQVFQETYHRPTYEKVHPQNTVKGDYLWRLYCMHRSMEAGVDDVGIGALFGLYDWKFEVMGLVHHALELENKFGIGPHTISFPRLEPACNTPYINNAKYKVSDADFEKLVTVIRLAVPYTGMILTARENADIRRKIIPLGCTQTDASSRIGIGAYCSEDNNQTKREQFTLGDTRSLDTVVRELAEMGYITSFCTAGYRCGRTGKKIMNLLRTGKEGCFCKLNAVITFREWLDDFATEQTKAVGEKVIAEEIRQIKEQMPQTYAQFEALYSRTAQGHRDLYF
ncbi:MAG: [FeFe] hydrogenase H-cluster radical SAM maturase HydG [Phycisphaerae bacterium]|jgi:2-iminoacetate synthase